MKYVIVVAVLLLMKSADCQDLKNPIIGKWKMHKVIQRGQNVTGDHNPEKNRYIIFKADSTFESGGEPYGINTGTYHFKKEGVLFIDSNAGEDDDSLWLVSFDKKNKRMIWKGASNQRASEFKLIHKRVKE